MSYSIAVLDMKGACEMKLGSLCPNGKYKTYLWTLAFVLEEARFLNGIHFKVWKPCNLLWIISAYSLGCQFKSYAVRIIISILLISDTMLVWSKLPVTLSLYSIQTKPLEGFPPVESQSIHRWFWQTVHEMFDYIFNEYQSINPF